MTTMTTNQPGLKTEPRSQGTLIAVDFRRRRRLDERSAMPVAIVIAMESFCGERGDQQPHSFKIGPRVVVIGEILDRWPAQDYRYFKVRTGENVVLFLRHDVQGNEWSMIT